MKRLSAIAVALDEREANLKRFVIWRKFSYNSRIWLLVQSLSELSELFKSSKLAWIFLALSYWTWRGTTGEWPFIKIFGTSGLDAAYKLLTRN